MPDNSEFKPCPFCGSEAVCDSNDIQIGVIHVVECSNEDCGGRMANGTNFLNIEEAIKAWNARPTHQEAVPISENHVQQLLMDFYIYRSACENSIESAKCIRIWTDNFFKAFSSQKPLAIKWPEKKDTSKHKQYPTRQDMRDELPDYGWNACLEACQKAVAQAGVVEASEKDIGMVIHDLEYTWRDHGDNKWEVMGKAVKRLIEGKQ